MTLNKLNRIPHNAHKRDIYVYDDNRDCVCLYESTAGDQYIKQDQ
jgi:hypothetical protein